MLTTCGQNRGASWALILAIVSGLGLSGPGAFAQAAKPLPAGLGDIFALGARHPGLRVCDRATLLPGARAKWRHKRSKLVAGAGNARHFANDAFSLPGAQVALHAKFTYGSISKDLQDEDVEVVMHDCNAWRTTARVTTDRDGWAAARFTAPAEPGVHAVVFRVAGDGTMTSARIWVVPEGTAVAVFDLDGTLTTSDDEIKDEVRKDYFSRVGTGKYDPQAFPGAADVTLAALEKGYLPVYLSGRPYWLLSHSRDWLERGKFAPGAVIHTRRHREVAPNQKGVGRFKRDVLSGLIRNKWRIERAYGNALTDVWAYSQAGVPVSSTWIIGPHAGTSETHKVDGDWTQVAKALRGSQSVAQPFDVKKP